MSQPPQKDRPTRQTNFSEKRILVSLMRNLRITKDKFYLALGRKMVSPALERCLYPETFAEAEVDMESVQYAICLNFCR